jgi:transketolase
MSLRHIFAETMADVGKSDENLVVIVGDISHGILSRFRSENPDRYFNIGISEPGMVNIAAGLSASGLVPVIHTIAPFLIERSYEQIKLDFAYQNLGGNFISVGGAFEYSKLGCSHHCYTDYALMSKFENCNIYYPGSANEFSIIFSQVYNNGKINYFRLTEYPNSFPYTPAWIIPGSAIIDTEGEDLTVVVVGALLDRVRNVAEKLESLGKSVEILYVHTLKPLDLKSIETSVQKTQRLLVIEENHENGGVFSTIASELGGKYKFAKRNLAIQGFIKSYGSYESLSIESGLSENQILEAAMDLLARVVD